ncbi:MAG: hypothetical protein IJ056_03520 [Acidaminococcaceae bacterium]|nr:hypothetical protein [Acidaminococcaceae bacterium]MBR1591285.1 hypothetical protein [Acidaminococcaceae bacterium]
MKKILIFCTLLVIMFTSVCGAEPVSNYCKLDQSKWLWLSSTDYQGTFFDYTSVENVPGANEKKVWVCTYTWVDDALGKGMHYVYVKYGINYDRNTAYMERGEVRDENLEVVKTYDKLKYNPQPIQPGTVLDRLAKRVASFGNGDK